MGCVYLARTPRGDQVALKAILLSDAARSTNVERFQVEAGILARIGWRDTKSPGRVFSGAIRRSSDGTPPPTIT
jgi:hypothetical protein